MNTEGAVTGTVTDPVTQVPKALTQRLDAYLGRLDLTDSKRSEIIEEVIGRIQTAGGNPTMAEAIATLHAALAQAQAVDGPVSARASAAQRTQMWLGAASQQQSPVDTSTYLQRPLVKRMAMSPETRPDVATTGRWRRMVRLYVGQ